MICSEFPEQPHSIYKDTFFTITLGFLLIFSCWTMQRDLMESRYVSWKPCRTVLYNQYWKQRTCWLEPGIWRDRTPLVKEVTSSGLTALFAYESPLLRYDRKHVSKSWEDSMRLHVLFLAGSDAWDQSTGEALGYGLTLCQIEALDL